MKERWKSIPGFPGYEASDQGRVRSYHRKGHKFSQDDPHLLKPSPRHGGRLYLTVFRNRKPHQISVHRLILLTFLGPCPSGKEACHNDGDCTNNRLSNLRWDTKKANWEDMRQHGRAPLGERSPNTRLTNADVIAIRVLYAKRIAINCLASLFEISPTSTRRIVTGQTWKHVGGPLTQVGQGDRSHNIYLTIFTH